jgi:FAD/FMN-containing dehydrogenase
MATSRRNGSLTGETEIGSEGLAALRGTIRGNLCVPGEDGYDEARTIWNVMIDRRPSVVVRCADAADVIRSVTFARERELALAIRGGGHNIAGNAVCDGGLVVDLSPMRSVRIDANGRTARVEAGATLMDFDRAAQAHGLATPLGINSTTGVAGLTLGGGIGWLSRKHGLTIDSLLAADVVTAAGERLRASGEENPDLFWGIRGGGGNLGVATSFEFHLHPVGPDVLAGLIVHPFAQAKELLDGYRQLAAEAPDELTCWVVVRKAPPLPFLPAEVHGTEILAFAACYAGDIDEGRRALEPLRALGEPIADVIGLQPYVGWQVAFDPLLAPGARNYWKSHNFAELSDDTIDAIIDYAGRLPTPECEIFVAQLGGAAGRVAADATAYPHRDARFLMNVHTRWRDPADDQRCIQWARDFFMVTRPYATGGVYVNFMPEDEADRVGSAYGTNLPRLAALKARFDPGNLFRLNQNVRPAV